MQVAEPRQHHGMQALRIVRVQPVASTLKAVHLQGTAACHTAAARHRQHVNQTLPSGRLAVVLSLNATTSEIHVIRAYVSACVACCGASVKSLSLQPPRLNELNARLQYSWFPDCIPFAHAGYQTLQPSTHCCWAVMNRPLRQLAPSTLTCPPAAVPLLQVPQPCAPATTPLPPAAAAACAASSGLNAHHALGAPQCQGAVASAHPNSC